MNAVLYIPAVGHVSALENTPARFHQSIHDLAALGCIESMITSVTNKSVVILLSFNKAGVPPYRRALECFRGYRPDRLEIDQKNRFLELSLRP